VKSRLAVLTAKEEQKKKIEEEQKKKEEGQKKRKKEEEETYWVAAHGERNFKETREMRIFAAADSEYLGALQ
jgi:hypothetical protein